MRESHEALRVGLRYVAERGFASAAGWRTPTPEDHQRTEADRARAERVSSPPARRLARYIPQTPSLEDSASESDACEAWGEGTVFPDPEQRHEVDRQNMTTWRIRETTTAPRAFSSEQPRATRAQIDLLVALGPSSAVAHSLTRKQAHGVIGHRLAERGSKPVPRMRLDPELLNP